MKILASKIFQQVLLLGFIVMAPVSVRDKKPAKIGVASPALN